MANVTPSSGQTNNSKEDFITKHGKRIVVIIFCILIGDALPAIIQNGLSPNKLFYTIVLMTLPYTGAMVLIQLLWIKNHGNGAAYPSYQNMMGTGLILLLGFGLGAYAHWGISDADSVMVTQQMDQANHPYHSYQSVNGRQMLANDMSILFQFYLNKYGAPLFIAATLASFVITWTILKWMEE